MIGRIGQIARIVGAAILILALGGLGVWRAVQPTSSAPPGRERVVFWHFWTDKKWRPVVESIVKGFNGSQDRFWVDPLAVIESKLEMKFYMAVAGGKAPDVLLQDNQIIPDWAHRGVIVPIDSMLPPDERKELLEWLYPIARKIGTYDGKLYGLCTAIDIRAIMFNAEHLRAAGGDPSKLPETLDEFTALCHRLSRFDEGGELEGVGYLPNPKRLWMWAPVFGGRFFDRESGRVTSNEPAVVRALEWMSSYSSRYGVETIAAFRSGDDQILGFDFPFSHERYSMILAGQWRVHDMHEFSPEMEYGVGALPPPKGGRSKAGWANGNFFVVPKNSRNAEGALAFMKYWSGFGSREGSAAEICKMGGWIPASPRVAADPTFRKYCTEFPGFARFVELASSKNLITTPSVPVQAFFYDRINQAADEAMHLKLTPQEALDRATEEIQARLDAVVGRNR